MKKYLLLLLLLSLMGCARAQTIPGDVYEGLPFPMEKIKLPVFPKHTVNIQDFGAVGDGINLCTDAFVKAIDALTAKGGGKLIVPRGLWFTGPIVLKSNINLHVEQGGVIIFSPDFDLYPLIETSFEGFDTRRCQSPLSANGAVNIAVTGEGVIDGNGQAWRPVKKDKMTAHQWRDLLASGGVLNEKQNTWWPSESALKGSLDVIDQNVPTPRHEEAWLEIKDFLRPVMVSFVRCKNVWLDGVTFQNSPAWNIHPLMCENLVISNLTVRNPWYSQNGDGLDVESCKNVVVYNSRFDVGDDAICIKSGKDADGRKRAMPTENLIVKACVVYHGHGGFVVGSEMSGGVKNVKVSECTFLGTDVGLRFKSTRGRGGIVENIWISDIDMMDIPAEPLLFDLFYGGKSALESKDAGTDGVQVLPAVPVDETTPQFRNIHIKNVVCKGAGRAMFFNGLPEMNVKNISLENISIHAGEGAVISETDGVTLKNVHIVPKSGEPIRFRNTKNVVTCSGDQPWSVRMAGSEMARHPDAVNLDFRKTLKWDYTFGLEGLAFIQLSEKTGDQKYFDYIEAYADTMINEAGAITTYKLSNYNIDHLNPGKMLFPIYEKTRKEKYKKALDMLREQINTHPRTNEGGFWHKKIYPYQMWLDGLYMGATFYAECVQRNRESGSLYDDVINQFIFAGRHTYDPATGLFRHAWDESREQAWADKETGQASQVWGRAMGWYAMALTDVLDFIPAQHPRRDSIISLLNVVARGIRQYQDTTGVWWQVMDKGGKEGNYLEATASTMFVYALLKAVKHQYIDQSYLATAKKGYAGIIDQFIEVDEKGLVNLTHCCAVAGLGGDPYRPGTYEYYLGEPIRNNDPKGVGPFIMASLLYEELK